MKTDNDGWIDRKDAMPGEGVEKVEVKFPSGKIGTRKFDINELREWKRWSHWRPVKEVDTEEQKRVPAWELAWAITQFPDNHRFAFRAGFELRTKEHELEKRKAYHEGLKQGKAYVADRLLTLHAKICIEELEVEEGDQTKS